jgi:hypothetical protein
MMRIRASSFYGSAPKIIICFARRAKCEVGYVRRLHYYRIGTNAFSTIGDYCAL